MLDYTKKDTLSAKNPETLSRTTRQVSCPSYGDLMFTLIALGTGTAYLYSLVATFAPGLFPAGFRMMGGGGDHSARPAWPSAGVARA